MHINVMTANLAPPPTKPPSHYEAPMLPVKSAASAPASAKSSGGTKTAAPERTKYETDTGIFTGKGTEGGTGPIPDKPTVTVKIEDSHPSNLVRKNDFDSVKTPESKQKPDAGTKKAVGPQKQDTPYKPLTPKQKKAIQAKVKNRTATKEEYKRLQWDRRFNNRRSRGVDRFWSQEKARLKAGESGTRDWSPEQRADILNNKTPKFDGQAIEGHHKYNALDYPHMADDPKNIFPTTWTEHFHRWHGGNFRNDTSGYPLNPLFPEDF